MTNKIYIFLLLITCMFTHAQENMITPPFLKAGDTIAIVAPAGILKNRQATILKAKQLAESWGLHVVIGKNIYNKNNHFAGTDSERCQDFQDALDKDSVKAIWAARGGYGSVRILDALDFTNFKNNPKWIIGYSDITAFHNHVNNLGIQSLHAMMATSLEQKPEEIEKTITSFKAALFGSDISYSIKNSSYNRTLGKTSLEGELIGGNLAIQTSMLGSKSQMHTDNKILFIEEIGEYKYAIDRMLQSLKRAGYFNNLSAVVIGDMSLIKKNSTKWGSSIEQLILDIVPENIPVIFNFPAGHEADNRALIFGRKAQIIIGDKFTELSFID